VTATFVGTLVGETVLGDRYELMVVRAEDAFGAASVACVHLGVGGSHRDPAEGSLTLTPDEARTLAGELDHVDDNYEPGTCRWATRVEQANNTSRNVYITAFGRTQTTAQWARELGLDYDAVRCRMENGWEPERALSQAGRSQRNKGRVGPHLFEAFGKKKTLTEWAKEIGLNYFTIRRRIERGMPIERALLQPVQKSVK
jgi:hypothetical protein